MFKRKEYLVIFIILVTEVLGFSLILPFLPFYIQKLGGTPLTVGLILTVFSIFQFFSAPILGQLSDVYGRKPLLVISQLSTFLSFIILGFSNTLLMIFVSRIVDGLFGSNATIAQSYLSDISSEKDRSKAFGISGAAFGFGFLIGPAIGGALAKISFSLPAFIAAGLSLITILMTIFFLEETVKKDKTRRITFDEIVKEIKIKRIFANLKNKQLAIPLWIFFAYILGHTIYVSNFALFGEKKLQFTVTTVGYVLAFVGLNSIILRGFLLEKLINKYGEKILTKVGFYSSVLGLLIFSATSNLFIFLLGLIFFATGSGLLRPTLLGDLSRKAPKEKQGEIIGIANSLGSISQIIGPIIGGYALTYFAPASLPFIAAMVVFSGLFLKKLSTNDA